MLPRQAARSRLDHALRLDQIVRCDLFLDHTTEIDEIEPHFLRPPCFDRITLTAVSPGSGLRLDLLVVHLRVGSFLQPQQPIRGVSYFDPLRFEVRSFSHLAAELPDWPDFHTLYREDIAGWTRLSSISADAVLECLQHDNPRSPSYFSLSAPCSLQSVRYRKCAWPNTLGPDDVLGLSELEDEASRWVEAIVLDAEEGDEDPPRRSVILEVDTEDQRLCVERLVGELAGHLLCTVSMVKAAAESFTGAS